MPLPKIKNPTYPLTLPLSGHKLTFRPYTVGDEKLLLAAASARESNPDFYVENTLKVIRNCIDDKEGLLETLPSVDVEYLLLQIRAKSVSETTKIKVGDEEVSINLEEVSLEKHADHDYKIALSDDVGVVMKDLSFVDKMAYARYDREEDKSEMVIRTLVDCIDMIWEGTDKVYKVGVDTTREEVQEFLEQLSGVTQKLFAFVTTMPQLAITVKLKGGKTRKLVGSELDFLA